MNKSISYSAVVLNDSSVNILKKRFSKFMPDEWQWIGHHMTINLGELSDKLKDRLGEEVTITVTKLGLSGLAMAVMVDPPNGIKTNNKIPHVTLAVNRVGGGKPVDSNKIINWDVDNFSPFPISGIITEVENRRGSKI